MTETITPATTRDSVALYGDEWLSSDEFILNVYTTAAMKLFVDRFDNREYTNLIVDWYLGKDNE